MPPSSSVSFNRIKKKTKKTYIYVYTTSQKFDDSYFFSIFTFCTVDAEWRHKKKDIGMNVEIHKYKHFHNNIPSH